MAERRRSPSAGGLALPVRHFWLTRSSIPTPSVIEQPRRYRRKGLHVALVVADDLLAVLEELLQRWHPLRRLASAAPLGRLDS